MKTCSQCKKIKSTDLFYRNKTKLDGFQTVCKECSKTYTKQLNCEKCNAPFLIKHRNISKRKFILCSECLLSTLNQRLIGRNKSRATYKIKTKKGYVQEYIFENGRYALYHRIVMERFLKRKLTKIEVIHHIDSDKTNNDISNLWLTTDSGHKKAHLSLVQTAELAVRKGLIKFNKKTGQYEIS